PCVLSLLCGFLLVVLVVALCSALTVSSSFCGRTASAESLYRPLSLLFEVGLAPVQVIEASRGLARELDMRNLVLAHRHVGCAIDQDVRALQQRVAEEAVGREVLALELLLLVPVARHTL